MKISKEQMEILGEDGVKRLADDGCPFPDEYCSEKCPYFHIGNRDKCPIACMLDSYFINEEI